MTFREAIVITLKDKTNALTCGETGISIYWDKAYNVYRVERKPFDTIEEAVDNFIKRTEHGRISKTDDEAECAIGRNN